jgi:hypothetical protein
VNLAVFTDRGVVELAAALTVLAVAGKLIGGAIGAWGAAKDYPPGPELPGRRDGRAVRLDRQPAAVLGVPTPRLRVHLPSFLRQLELD